MFKPQYPNKVEQNFREYTKQLKMLGPICSSAAKNFVREGLVNDVVSHWRLSNSWKLMQNTSKNLSKFVSKGAMASSASLWLRHCQVGHVYLTYGFTLGKYLFCGGVFWPWRSPHYDVSLCKTFLILKLNTQYSQNLISKPIGDIEANVKNPWIIETSERLLESQIFTVRNLHWMIMSSMWHTLHFAYISNLHHLRSGLVLTAYCGKLTLYGSQVRMCEWLKSK